MRRCCRRGQALEVRFLAELASPLRKRGNTIAEVPRCGVRKLIDRDVYAARPRLFPSFSDSTLLPQFPCPMIL